MARWLREQAIKCLPPMNWLAWHGKLFRSGFSELCHVSFIDIQVKHSIYSIFSSGRYMCDYMIFSVTKTRIWNWSRSRTQSWCLPQTDCPMSCLERLPWLQSSSLVTLGCWCPMRNTQFNQVRGKPHKDDCSPDAEPEKTDWAEEAMSIIDCVYSSENYFLYTWRTSLRWSYTSNWVHNCVTFSTRNRSEKVCVLAVWHLFSLAATLDAEKAVETGNGG